LTPRSILEAMLFVGNSQNQPLTADQVASLMRGVRPQEINDLVQELNDQYSSEECPYRIASVDAGYIFQLREEYVSLRENFYGRVKDAKLTQQAVDVLAIVAYKQPLTREEVDQIRGRPCGGVLAQLVRRELLCLDRSSGKSKTASYRTTHRFLQVFGLESLDELPDSQEES
jgi:segregation and condensation protein B